MALRITMKSARKLTLGLLHAVALLIALTTTSSCEAKEFDWSDLGVSLANAKPSLGGSGSSASNLRILVSPQRRITKNYEFDYNNGSQALSSSGQAGDASSYVVSGSSSPYLGQSVYQLSPNHSSAYSALSASLATLKNRLSARGMTLSGTSLGDSGAPSGGHLYATSNGGSYGSSVLLDAAQQAQSSQQQAQQQAQQQQQQQSQPSQSSQPTYLSVSSNQHDSQSLGAYTMPPSQGSESNKTIVLAIPAKINFLTGASSSKHATSQQQQQQQQPPQQQQAQHLSILQPSGVINGQEASVEQTPGAQTVVSEAQEPQHQYVILNQPGGGDHHSHSVAAGLSPSAVGTGGQVYSTAIYQPATGSYSIKQYIPAYTQAVAAQPASMQKVYSVLEPAAQQAALQPVQAVPQAAQGGQQQQQQQQLGVQYESQPLDQESTTAYGTSRYANCLDTCNSSDPRWRKYTVSKYKACCSRSAQFDPAFEQPSADRVNFETMSSRYAAEDAYYQHLAVRRARARRTRRQRPNRYANSGHSARYASSSAQQAAEEEPLPDSPVPQGQSEQAGTSGGVAPIKSSYASRNPYYYRSRAYSGQGASDVSPGESVATGGSPADEIAASGAGNKYYGKQERYSSSSYRRGRGRDLSDVVSSDAPSQAGQLDSIEDDAVYPREQTSGRGLLSSGAPSSYGSGEYSVDLQGRGYGSSGRGGADSEDEPTRFDEQSDLEAASKGSAPEAADYQSEAAAPMEPGDDSEIESQSGGGSGGSYRAQAYAGGASEATRKRRKQGKARRRQLAAKGEQKQTAAYYKKSRKVSKTKSSGQSSEHATLNGTDYESAQPGDSYNFQETPNLSNNEQQQEDQSTYSGKDQASASGSSYEQGGVTESEKDAMLAKYRASLNDTTVANLSKTTMHLKEILSILEKKAAQQIGGGSGGSQPRYNESQLSSPQPVVSQQQPVTSTPAPITTSWRDSLSLASLLNSPSFGSSALSSDFLTSDFSSLKSPYRYDPTSFSVGSLGSSALSLPSSSPFGSFSPDSLSLSAPPPPPPYPSQYSFQQATKHLVAAGNQGALSSQRKRRPSKSSRYNELVLQKAAHGLVTPSSLLSAKNRLLNPAYYSTLSYPYLYRGNSPSITSPYPYKNHHKNPYSSLLSGPVSSKLAAAAAASSGSGTTGGLYTDESRLQSISNLDPLAQVASSLRSPSAMRLRSKPFIFQPQVLPVYTRHAILTSPLDLKA